MKIVSAVALFAGILAAASASPVLAAPIHITFDGAVSGTTNFYTHVLSDYGIGTNASFDLTFDDSDVPTSASFSFSELAPLSGSLQLGTDQWSLDYGRAAVSYLPEAGIVGLQTNFTGTGPATHTGGVLSFLYFNLTPELTLVDDSIKVGFAYEDGSVIRYSYAALTGTFNLERTTSVPVPSTVLLLLPALTLLWCSRRRRDTKRTAFAFA